MLRIASRFLPGLLGYETSTSTNNKEADPLSEKLSNLVFNLGVFTNAENAKKMADQLCDGMTHRVIKTAENKIVVDTVIDMTAEIIATQLNIGSDWIKAGLKETVEPALENVVAKGRVNRAKKAWTWAKKVLSPLKGVARPVFNAVGESYALTPEKTDALNNLASDIETLVSQIRDKRCVKRYVYEVRYPKPLSINPFNVGLCKAISNIFLKCMITLGICEEPEIVQTHMGERPWDINDFEQEVDQALQKKSNNQLNLTVIAQQLGLKNLTSQRYHTFLRGTVDAARAFSDAETVLDALDAHIF